MSFYVENTAPVGEFKAVPAGLHLARCYRIIDLGTQRSEFDGQEKYQRKIMLGWELHGKDEEGNELVTDRGDPMAIFKNYTLSWNDKATLRLDLQSWRGKPFTEAEMRRFDISTVLGAWCMLTVIPRPGKNGKIYSNVKGVSPVASIIKQAGLPPAINPNQLFRLAEPDFELYDTFGKGLKAMIEASPEWQAIQDKKPAQNASKKASSGFDDMEDDLPF
jgi:hypothetical protein